MSTHAIDAVSLSIMWDRLVGITDEIISALIRSSFSTIVRESGDLSVVVLDTEGNSMAQGSYSVPSFTGTAAATLRHMLAKFPPDSLEPGDVIATNDAWMGTGHLFDINLMRPVFRNGRIAGYTLSITHLPDIGGLGFGAAAERFVRRLLDTRRTEVFVSGSSAALLSREIASSLRGRAWPVLIHPFSFEEACRHRGIPVPEHPGILSRHERLRLERAFADWLHVGGFPEAQGLDAPSRHQLLRDYVDVAILRDVVDRHRVSNVTGLRWLARHLLGNAGGLFSVEKFHGRLKAQGIAIARDTVHQMLGFLDDCFLVRVVSMESSSERQRMVNPRKAHPVDPGLIPVYDTTGRANLGHALETAVLVELERRRLDVTYVHTPQGHEVDFLARGPERRPELIQVCADLSDAAVVDRELRALEAAGERFPDAGKRLLTLDRDNLPGTLPDGVVAETAYEWMLNEGAPS